MIGPVISMVSHTEYYARIKMRHALFGLFYVFGRAKKNSSFSLRYADLKNRSKE